MNYIEYFQTGNQLPELTPEQLKDLEIKKKLYESDKPLPGTDPLLSLWVMDKVLGGPTEYLLKSAINVGKKAIPVVSKGFSKIREAISSKSPNITERFLKMVDSKGAQNNEGLVFDLGESQLQLLAQLLEKRGVDMSKITKQDLQKALDIRKQNIIETAPKRYSLVTPDDVLGNSQIFVDDVVKGKQVGQTTLLTGSDDAVHIGNVINISPKIANGRNSITGVLERGLNSAIQIAEDLGRKGVVTGELYLMPEVSTKVVSKMPDKILISNKGQHSYKTGTKDGPVYLLNKLSQATPTKSIIFDPIIIDKHGRINTDWTHKSIFRTVTPTILETAGAGDAVEGNDSGSQR